MYLKEKSTTKKPLYREPLYNEVLAITNNFLYTSNNEIYEKEPRYNETSLKRTNFASSLARCSTVHDCVTDYLIITIVMYCIDSIV